uniref:Uncharacterized protein n=1 Tax=Arundo donax TaxID=35708 RepID=A0A0A8ZWS4_ARUDO
MNPLYSISTESPWPQGVLSIPGMNLGGDRKARGTIHQEMTMQ